MFDVLNLELLLVIAFLHGCCTVFFDVAYVSYMPDIVQKDLLPLANSRLEMTRAASQIVGPSLGGYLIQALSASFAVLADAASFVVSFVTLLFIPNTYKKPSEKKNTSIWKDIREGLVFVSSHKVLKAIMTSYSLNVFFIGLFQSVSVVYMTRTLNVSASSLGIILTLGNVGFLVGASISRRYAKKVGIGAAIISSLGILSFGFLISGSAPRTFAFPLLIVGQFVTSMGVPIYNVNLISLRQVITPQPLLARVSSVSRMIGRGAVPFGALLGGGLASTIGPRGAVLTAGIGGILALLPGISSGLHKFKSINDINQKEVKNQ